jgi:hypothetical protein
VAVALKLLIDLFKKTATVYRAVMADQGHEVSGFNPLVGGGIVYEFSFLGCHAETL